MPLSAYDSTTFRCFGCQNRTGVNNAVVRADRTLVCRPCASRNEVHQVGAYAVEVVG